MVRDIVRDPAFLRQKAEPATRDDNPAAQDLLETLQEIASRSAQEGIDDLWREALDQSGKSLM